MDAARLARVTAASVLCLGLLLGLVAPAAQAGPGAPGGHPASETETSAEQQLAERYAPVVVVRQQNVACLDGEPYAPQSVDVVLGRRDVVLRTPRGDITAPTARDLFAAPKGSNLDLPGQPLSPGCSYEKWADQVSAGSKPTVYARVVADPGGTEMVVQYWFWWIYNDWNDRHEGDWEMVQLSLPAADAKAALDATPDTVAFAQHEGAELSDWDQRKLTKVEGTHVVVYPGQGSHAAYYTQAQWFGREAATGFGCDDTRPLGTQIRPVVELLPAQVPTSAGDRHAWLAYPGRWGQQAPTFNNGPTGPAAKDQWAQPVQWMDDSGRRGAVALPPGTGVAAGGFCALVGAGSLLFFQVLKAPVVVAIVLLALLLLVVWLVRRTTWRDSRPDDLDRERSGGQLFAATFGVLRRLLPTLWPVGAAVFVMASTVAIVRALAIGAGSTGSITDVGGSGGDLTTLAVTAATWVVQLVGQAVAVTVVIDVLGSRATGGPRGVRAALARLGRDPAPALTFLLATSVVVALAVTLVLLPLALYLTARWAVSFAAATVEGLGVRDALRRSDELTRGRRWRVGIIAATLLVLGLTSGPVVGGLLLLVTGWPTGVVNAIGGVVSAVALMVPAVGMGLLFLDLRRRGRAEADTPVSAAARP